MLLTADSRGQGRLLREVRSKTFLVSSPVLPAVSRGCDLPDNLTGRYAVRGESCSLLVFLMPCYIVGSCLSTIVHLVIWNLTRSFPPPSSRPCASSLLPYVVCVARLLTLHSTCRHTGFVSPISYITRGAPDVPGSGATAVSYGAMHLHAVQLSVRTGLETGY